MKRAFLLLTATSLTLLLSGCLGGAFELGSSAPAPTDVRVIAGDGSVTVTWTAAPKTEYWVFAAPGQNVTPENWLNIGGFSFPKATSPLVIHNLTNGKPYSFTINARIDGGPGGPGSPSITATPRLAGGNWTLLPALGNTTLNGVAAQSDANGNTRFVAVGNAGTIYTSNYFNAHTPLSWTAVTPTLPTPTPDFSTVVYGGVFLAAGSNGTVLRSTDAQTWTLQTTGTTRNILAITTNGAGGYVAVGQGGLILTSLDGINWNTQTSGTTQNLYAATYGDGLWIVVGQGGLLLTSTNGVTWTPAPALTHRDLNGIAYGLITDATTGSTSGAFIAVGAAGTQLISTDQGASWRLGNIGNNNLKAILFGRQFIAAGNNGSLYTSTDGTQWTLQSSGTSNDLNALSAGISGLAAVGAAGTTLSAF